MWLFVVCANVTKQNNKKSKFILRFVTDISSFGVAKSKNYLKKSIILLSRTSTTRWCLLQRENEKVEQLSFSLSTEACLSNPNDKTK